MKTNIHTIAMLSFFFVIAVTSPAIKLSRINQPVSMITQADIFQKSGPGPMCPPTTGCGTESPLMTVGIAFASELLDGPGPMCPPTSGCGNESFVQKTHETVFLLASGPGPMCPPTTGCGKGNTNAVKES